MFLPILCVVAEFEVNLIELRTRENMAVARARGELCSKKPKLPPSAQRTVVVRYATGKISLTDLATEYSVSRTTIHRIVTGHRRAVEKTVDL